MKHMALTLAGLLIAAAAGLVIWGYNALNNVEQWPIRWLEVVGELDRTTAEQVRAAVAAEASDGFFAIDIDRARAAVEQLPWVEQAQLSRHWPDALEIEVREHRVVARWNETGLLSASGAVFDVAGTSGMQGLTALNGPESRREDVFTTWQALRKQLVGVGLDLSRIELDPRGAWSLTLDSGQALLLGREQIHQRLNRFLAVHRQLLNMDTVARIDLRYPNGLAITRRAKVEQSEAPENAPTPTQASTAQTDRASRPATAADLNGLNEGHHG
ncbi:MAG: cell division protein FtsQ/DivIB [Pseudomonadota bacterium]